MYFFMACPPAFLFAASFTFPDSLTRLTGHFVLARRTLHGPISIFVATDWESWSGCPSGSLMSERFITGGRSALFLALVFGSLCSDPGVAWNLF